MTGEELRAWRERLGKDEAWIHEILDAVDVASGSHNSNGSTRRLMVELGHHEGSYDVHEREALRTAYSAALEAEEARQVAERGPVEPVCPEGVWRGDEPHGWWYVSLPGTSAAPIAIEDGGRICFTELAPTEGASPALLRYAADLSEYRAALHAASDRQRKLDAVRAAEEAHDAAHKATEDAYAAYREAEAAVGRTHSALKAARREAGL